MSDRNSESRPSDSKRKDIVFEQVIACVLRTVSGALLILGGYYALDVYRYRATYAVQYSEQRLQRLANLWTATDRHGIEVLKTLAGPQGKEDAATHLGNLGENYYLELASTGVFLGQDRIHKLRIQIGDIWLRENEAALLRGSPQQRNQALKIFRSNWLCVLKELEVLGETSGL